MSNLPQPQEPQTGLQLPVEVWAYFNELFANRGLVTQEGQQQLTAAFNDLYNFVQTAVAQRDAEWKAWSAAQTQAGIEAHRDLEGLKSAMRNWEFAMHPEVRALVQAVMDRAAEPPDDDEMAAYLEGVYMHINDLNHQRLEDVGVDADVDELRAWMEGEIPWNENILRTLFGLVDYGTQFGHEENITLPLCDHFIEGEFEEDDEE